MMADEFTRCETGLEELLKQLGKEHPDYSKAQVLQFRLLENIEQVRQYTDSENLRSERNRVLAQLNRLAEEAIGRSFNTLCWSTGRASAKEAFRRFDIELVCIPAGWSVMGSGEDDYGWEKPQHAVYLDEFWIGRYPVTNAQYHEAVEAGLCEPPIHSDRYDDPGCARHPVVGVNWYQALAFAEGVGGRLPTEAEWEKAARGTDGRLYPWGDDWDAVRCNSLESGILTTTPVDRFSPQGDSPYGCSDMAGNVWEWTLSLWGLDQKKPDFTYPYEGRDGREDVSAPNTALRIVRGGAFHVESQYLRCAFRYWNFPNASQSYLGFRMVIPGNLHLAGKGK